MINGRVSITARNRAEVERLIMTRSANRIIGSIGTIRAELEAEVRKELKANFILDRPTSRRRSPGSPRLINSFEAKRESPGNSYPITISIGPNARARGNADSMAKINSLLSGSKRHDIVRKGRGTMRFPWTGVRGAPYPAGSAGRKLHAYTTEPNAKTRYVDHPGTPKVPVLEDAARRVADRMQTLIK